MSRKRVEKNIAFDDRKELFYAYFDLGFDGEGKRLRRSRTFHQLEDAERAVESFDSANADWSAPERITLGAWLDYWLEDVIRPNRAKTTCYCYWSIIKNHIVPALGKIPVRELQPFQIQRYYTIMMQSAGLGPNTVHKHHVLLHTALKLAFQQGLIAQNPVERVEPPKERPARQLYYTPQQLKRLFQLVNGTPLELPVKLAGYLGLRRGEICGLRWENVDLEQGLIAIRSVRTTAGWQVVEKEPKTDSSARTLGIRGLEDLEEILRRTRQTQEARIDQKGERYHDTGYVLAYNDGAPWHPNEFTHRLHAFVESRGLAPITVHGLRHTFASAANSARVPMLDIGKALGHKDITITGRIYTHIFDQTHSEVIASVAQCIRGA